MMIHDFITHEATDKGISLILMDNDITLNAGDVMLLEGDTWLVDRIGMLVVLFNPKSKRAVTNERFLRLTIKKLDILHTGITNDATLPADTPVVVIDVLDNGIHCVPLWTWERVNWFGADPDDRMWVIDRISTFLDWSELT